MRTVSALVCILAMMLPCFFMAAHGESYPNADRCGIQRSASENSSNAALEACAESGDPDAQAELGFIYWSAAASTECRGNVCQPADPSGHGLASALSVTELQAEGRRLIEAAARAGHAAAQNELGVAHLQGEHGQPIDLDAALAWLRAAAEGGDPIAPWNLARMYFSGNGVERSVEQAVANLRLSAQRGYSPARCSLLRWLSQYSDENSRNEANSLQSTLRSARQSCGQHEFMPEMRLMNTADTL